MLDVRITFAGDTVVSRRLHALAERAADLRPAWLGVQEEFFRIMGRAFRSEGASTGSPWPALALSTARERASIGYGAFHPILQRTQALRRSLTQRGGDNFTVGTPRSLALGSAVEYFPFHHSRRPRTRLPRRGFDLTAEDTHALMRPVRRWVTGHDVNAPVRGRPR